MIRHIWTVLASRAIVDGSTNSLSLVDVVDELSGETETTPPSDATLPVAFSIVSLWTRADASVPATGRVRVRLLSPSGASLSSSEYDVELQTHIRRRMITNVAGFPLRENGRYEWQIDVKGEIDAEWREVARVPLDLSVKIKSVESR